MNREQIQRELALLGPERVRRGLVAFEHRAHGVGNVPCTMSWCCLLTHAMEHVPGMSALSAGRTLLTRDPSEQVIPLVEKCFEGWAPRLVNGVQEGVVPRHESQAFLRGEMLLFLAERGVVPEPAPAPQLEVA